MSLDSPNPSDDDVFNRGTVHTQAFSWDGDDGAAMAVVETVAAVTNQRPMNMEPLNNVINTDALNSLFVSTDDAFRHSGHVQFEYEGCHVRISSDGTVSAVTATAAPN